MSTNTNGIATQVNLYSLNSEAFPNWSGGLKCPTKSEILAAVNSNFTATIANTNNYSNNQLVKYSDISIVDNTPQNIEVIISLSYKSAAPNDQPKWLLADFVVNGVGGELIQKISCYINAGNTSNVYGANLLLKKNIPYKFSLNQSTGVSLKGDFNIGGVIGGLNETITGTPSWPIGEMPKGTINIS